MNTGIEPRADDNPDVETPLRTGLRDGYGHIVITRGRSWRDAGYELTMAVNLGARCLAEGSAVFEIVEELSSAWEIPACDLTLELTESALIDTAVPGLWDRLQAMGQRFSIDDFGTGYSSLAYLQQLPVFEIKADKSFVTTMTSVKDDAVIVRSIIELAHNLSLQVVAEGVEDPATMSLLTEYGCDAAQGYHFSRPLPAADLLRWLDASSFGSPQTPGRAVPAGVTEISAPHPREASPRARRLG